MINEICPRERANCGVRSVSAILSTLRARFVRRDNPVPCCSLRLMNNSHELRRLADSIAALAATITEMINAEV